MPQLPVTGLKERAVVNSCVHCVHITAVNVINEFVAVFINITKQPVHRTQEVCLKS